MLNKTTLQGRLVRDPETRTTQSGVSVASFTVAWSEKYKETETKCFLPCAAWRNTGEFVQKYFSKGQEIVVEGQLSTREWTDKEGNKRSSIELTVDKAHFCGPKHDAQPYSSTAPAANSGASYAPSSSGDFVNVSVNDDDLPF